MFKKKILIIDDTELMVRFITDILKTKDYDVVSASDGMEGIRKVAQEKPDLVLLDLVMPGMDGFEVCKILREDDSNNLMPIIILTSQGDEEDKLTALELGADDYIIKPFNPRELLSRVNNTLKRVDRNRLANPLTGLRGNLEIQAEITRRIATSVVFSVIYADLDNFKPYNDVYGFARGDAAIKLTADIITDNVSSFGTVNDFIGHVGGDDFVVITEQGCTDAICKGIIDDFDRKIISLYNDEDVKRGYIITKNRKKQVIRYPILSISIAVVSNEHRKLKSHLEVAEIAAELKKKAKAVKGSIFVKDRRRH